jgi:signal transduction histidine kinase
MTLGAEGDVASLRQELRDVVAVLSLPLMWRGRTPPQIAENLAEVLTSLLRLDFLHLRIMAAAGGEAIEQTRQHGDVPGDPGDIVERWQVADAAGPEEAGSSVAIDIQVDHGPALRVARIQPGVQPDQWHVLAGARRRDFPTERERFLLRVTVDQAAVGIETARLFHEAEQASLAKSQFIATMSHELRTPLNAILGYVDLLMLGVPEPVAEPAQQHIGRIRTSARHLLQLIDSILSFARMEAGREEIHLETVDLRHLTRDSVELLEPLARRRGLDFDCHVPDTAVAVQTDSAKVRQILFNLISNAIKFTDQGRVGVRMETAKEHAVIHVQDTGVGIAEDELARIFEPFRQVEGSLTRSAGGTGLGLSVARNLADLLGGTLSVESRVGSGSTFTLRLPMDGEAAADGSNVSARDGGNA